jgi:pimeloyl-ACP methyl ester carboxylesterase
VVAHMSCGRPRAKPWHTAGMEAGLRVHQGGSGEPALLLLHGLGATGDVWQRWRTLLAQRWPGRWMAPDLPGHGGSPPLSSYTFGALAAGVAGLVGAGARTVVLGHSLGGVVGLALAGGGFDVPVQAVIGLGIKVAWTEEELGRAQAAAHRSPAWFASRDEAATRYLRISGLTGLLAADDPAVDAGLREQHGRWRLTMDPGAFGVGAPDMAQLLARAQAPVTLARGEHDAMNTDAQLTRLGVPAVTLPGLGHNAHVQSPQVSITLLDPYRHAVDRPA